MNPISTDGAPKAVGPYSQAAECNGTVYVSGQLPIDPADGSVPDGIRERTIRALENVKAIAEAAGCSMSDCVKVTVFMSDISEFPEVNAAYAEMFSEPYPARSCVEVSRIPKGMSLEIDAIFVRGQRQR
ncbi:MAG: RidA family protein [Candidatus Methanomethylophilaceae archaeon]